MPPVDLGHVPVPRGASADERWALCWPLLERIVNAHLAAEQEKYERLLLDADAEPSQLADALLTWLHRMEAWRDETLAAVHTWLDHVHDDDA
jgi:hypothetical protein